MANCLALIRVRVPDRPGALGLVASRIGALRGDIVGIEVLDRTGGVALDELAVVLPDGDVIPALAREIAEVDGTVTESVTVVAALPEPRLDAYKTAIALCRAVDDAAVFEVLATSAQAAVRADWCSVLDGGDVVVGTDTAPAEPTATAVFLHPVGTDGIILAIGRATGLGTGELELVRALGDLADAASTRGVRTVSPPA